MPNESKQKKTKLKLLYIKEYLEKYSDEDNPVSADELSKMLLEKGIECERKSIYSDIQSLRDYGMDIFRVRVPKNGYYLGTRVFELPEIKLLCDAVSAANFISEGKTQVLEEKLSTLCSVGQLPKTRQKVYIGNVSKQPNEDIYYNIDVIDRAIKENKQITFTYRRKKLNADKMEITYSQKKLTLSPYAMIWQADNYYLVGNNAKYDNLMHVRIDRMKKVEIIEEKRRHISEVSSYKEELNAEDYSSKVFNMFSGEVCEIELDCDNSIIEEILDGFDYQVKLSPSSKENCFIAITTAAVSKGLISWLLQFGGKVEVIKPSVLRNSMCDIAKEISTVYL